MLVVGLSSDFDQTSTFATPLRSASAQGAILDRLQEDSDEFAAIGRPFLENYCLDCHDGVEGDGGIDLSLFHSSLDVE